MKTTSLALSGLLLLFPSGLRAGCCEHHEAAELFQTAGAVGEYRIVSAESVTDETGRLFTRFTAELNVALKGEAPAGLVFQTPGGRRGRLVEISSLGLDLEAGDDCILHLQKNADGSWSPQPFQTFRNGGTHAEKKALRDYFRTGARGRMPRVARPAKGPGTGTDQGNSGVPGSVVTPTGYSENSGQPTRFTVCDGGQPIPYIVDIDAAKLPPGMTADGALSAVEEALGVWSAASSLKFRFDGTQTFGTAASTVATNDGRLRIQLHDSFNVISGSVLGIGGGEFTTASTVYRGGRIGSQGFQERLRGYVVLEHNAAFMDNAANFKQVLTHEIGHALGLAHSSENASEPNAILKNATMYYSASNDGRGAALTVYDQDRIAFGYPTTNKPPYTPDRIIRAVCRSNTSATLPAVAGVNRIELRALDLEGSTLTPVLHATSSAKFSLSGNQLVYAATDFATGSRLTDAQIESGTFYALGYVQFNDGTNLSRAARCTVIEIASDSTPADGLPNTWMTTNFATTTPGAAGASHHPDSDPDGDGLTNREEFFFNTNPTSATSGPIKLDYDHETRTMSFTPVRFIPYTIESASGIAGPWTRRCLTTNFSATGSICSDLEGSSGQSSGFFRVVSAP